jgi:hypothetical protein
MTSVKAHLEQEYTQNRITGSDYSNVYLSAMTAVMQQSVAFLLSKEKAGHEADLAAQQVTNAGKEFEVLHAQKCKLDAEYDVLLEQKLKVIAETALLGQKQVTEAAQTGNTNVSTDSVIGKQKTLYDKQAAGFDKSAEQKAASLMVDAWNVQRTTSPDTVIATPAGLSDANVKRSIDKMLSGVGA